VGQPDAASKCVANGSLSTAERLEPGQYGLVSNAETTAGSFGAMPPVSTGSSTRRRAFRAGARLRDLPEGDTRDTRTFLARTVLLLRLLSQSGVASPRELTVRSGLARPTVHRLLALLMEEGLVVREQRGSYRLGMVLSFLGRSALASIAWVDRTRPLLDELSRELGGGVHVYVREGGARMCVCAAGEDDRQPPVGWPLPLHAGASGHVLLAWSADAGRFPAVAADTLRSVRTRGWASAADEWNPGATSLCVPFFHPQHGVYGALCAAGGARPVAELARRLEQTARELEVAVSPY
jgi:DNA-binding IclR family transcriptional regulator